MFSTVSPGAVCTTGSNVVTAFSVFVPDTMIHQGGADATVGDGVRVGVLTNVPALVSPALRGRDYVECGVVRRASARPGNASGADDDLTTPYVVMLKLSRSAWIVRSAAA